MAIISFDPDTIIEYVPEYGGNRDSDEPCVVRLKFVPYSRAQHYQRVLDAALRDVRDADRAADIRARETRKQFVECVESVSNYYIGEREVTSPGEFYDSADVALILEVMQALTDAQRLSEGQRKN